jgi:serine/threonine protein kinase
MRISLFVVDVSAVVYTTCFSVVATLSTDQTTVAAAQVCDFGTSRLLTSHRPLHRETSFDGGTDVTATMTKGVGTLLWMAPELFHGGSKYGPEVDVYVAICAEHPAASSTS